MSLHMLAIETSADACSVALLLQRAGRPEEILVSHEIAPMQQAKILLNTIQNLLDQASIQLHQLNAIAYGAGPGSFTGLRLVSSVVQGIGYIHKIPVIAVSSLAALAQSAYQRSKWDRIWVAVDARQNQLYWAAYQLGKRGYMEPISDEKLISPQDIPITDDGNWCGVGDAWGLYAVEISRKATLPSRINPSRTPTAQAVIELAKAKHEDKNWIAPFDAIPVYLNPFKR